MRALTGGIAARLAQVEGTDSDGEGNTNLQEINANAQQGWCAASKPGCNNGGFTLPAGVTLLDPASANQAPLGLTVLPCSAISTRYKSPLLKVVPFKAPVPSRRVAIAWRKGFARPQAVEVLAQAIRAIDIPCVQLVKK